MKFKLEFDTKTKKIVEMTDDELTETLKEERNTMKVNAILALVSTVALFVAGVLTRFTPELGLCWVAVPVFMVMLVLNSLTIFKIKTEQRFRKLEQ